MALAEYGNALNIDTDGSGNPILVDPQSGDVIAIYDRASGAWQVTEIEATTGDFDSVNTENLNNTLYKVDTDVSDLGAELQRLHDNVCSHFDTILIPPGEYTQSTKFTNSKWVNLRSTGDHLNPGATIKKDSDIVQMETTTYDRPSGSTYDDGAVTINGVKFDGNDVADSSDGVVLRTVTFGAFSSDNHGRDGVRFATNLDEEDTANWSKAFIHAYGNSQDGIHTVNENDGLIDLNAMRIVVKSKNNGRHGVYNEDGYSNYWGGDCSQNGDGTGTGVGWLLDGRDHFAQTYSESNAAQDRYECGTSAIWTLTAPTNFDQSVVPSSTVVYSGNEFYGEQRIVGKDGAVPKQLMERAGTVALSQYVDPNGNIQKVARDGGMFWRTTDSTGSVTKRFHVPGGADNPNFILDEVARLEFPDGSELYTSNNNLYFIDSDGNQTQVV